MKKILITGATGFVGKAIAKYLSKENFYLIGVTRKRENTKYYKNNEINEWVEIDLTKDIDKLSYILQDTQYVIHAAGLTPKKNNIPCSAYLKFNTEITKKMIQIAANAPAVKRFIYISTIKVHGEKTSNYGAEINELSEIKPQDHYSMSKYLAEMHIKEGVVNKKMGFVIFRPPMVYGEGVSGNFLLLIKLAEKEIPVPFALIKNSRSILYSENFANAISLSIDHPDAYNQVFVIKDLSISVPQLFEELAIILGKQPKIYPVHEYLLKLLGTITFLRSSVEKITDSLKINDAKLRNLIGWRPVIGFNESLKSTVSWYLETK